MLKKRKWLLFNCILLAVLLCFVWVQNTWLEVTHYTYESPEVPQEFVGFRVVQISDLHNATFGKENEKLLLQIRELSPDIVVLTGDLVDSTFPDVEVALDFAEKIAADFPTYYITGNHESWLKEKDRSALFEGLEKAGVVCLFDEFVEIKRGNSSITLIGLCDESLGGMKVMVTEHTTGENLLLAENETTEGLQILLAHEPQYLKNYSKYAVDLVLSGHAHGGQFRNPFGDGGLVAPGQGFFPEYIDGVHVMNETTMIISRGLGNSIIPVRAFNRPEIVCVEMGQ